MDNTACRLYVSRGTKVFMIDLETDKLVGEINDIPGVHGIALTPELKRVFVFNHSGNDATVFDAAIRMVFTLPVRGCSPCFTDRIARRVIVFIGSAAALSV